MKKIFKWAGHVLLAIIIIVFAGFLTWESITYYTFKKVAQFYAGKAHIEIDIGVTHGSPFYHTTLENVSIGLEAEQPQIYHFKAQSITCSYNLWDLKEGLESFIQGLNCSARDPEFAYDFRAITGRDNAGDGSAQFLFPAVLPALDLHNGTVLLTHAGWITALRGINASLRSAEAGAHELQLQVENLQFSQDGVTKIDTGFTSLLRYDGAKLTINSFEMGKQEISATGFIDLEQSDKGLAEYAFDLGFAESRLNITGSMEEHLLKVHVRTGDFDSAELQKRLGGTDWNISGKITAEADLAYNLESQEDFHGSLVLGGHDGQLHGVQIGTFSIAAAFDTANVKISSAEARTPGNHILVSDVSVPVPLLQEGEVLSIIGGSRGKFEVDAADFRALLKLSKVDEETIPEVVRPNALKITGTLENGAIYIADAKVAATGSGLTIERAKIPIPQNTKAFESVPVELDARFESTNLAGFARLFGDTQLAGQVAAEMSIRGSLKEARGVLSLTVEDLGYRNVQLGSLAMQGELRVIQEKVGELGSMQFTIAELTQTNNAGTIALLSPIKGAWKPESFSLHGAVQVDGQAEVAISVAKSRGRETTAEISTRNLGSDGWLGNFVDKPYFFHGADIEAVLAGLPKNPQLQLTGSIKEASRAGMGFPLTGKFGLKYASKGIEISEFVWNTHEINRISLTGFLPYDPLAQEPFQDGELTLEGHIDLPALEDIGFFLEPLGISKGSVAMDMALSGSWQHPFGHFLLEAKGIEPPDTMKQYTDSPMDITCDLDADQGAIVLNSATLESDDYRVQARGSWQHGLTVTELLQKNMDELGGEISADAEAQLKDLNFIRKRVPWMRRFDGVTQVKLHVSGPAAAPSLKGSFFLKDGEVSHTLNFPMLSEVNLQGEFDEASITITSMKAEVGGSPVNLSGSVNREGETVAVNLHADGRNLLLFRNNDMRLRGDVQLQVSGPWEHLLITGTTGLTGGYYNKNIDFLGKIGVPTAPVSRGGTFLFSFGEEPLKNAVLDIRITTIEPFRIRNNLIRGTLRPELTLKGTGEVPFLVGTIYIDPSRVLLPSGRLQVQSGLVRFLEKNPDRPLLNLLATSKVLDYDINIVIQGPIDDPVITLSSSPALPNDDLLLLLLTGQPPQEGNAVSDGMGRSATNVMVYLGRDFLNKWLEEESGTSNETFLDRFEIDYGRSVSKSGVQTVESTFRLSKQETGKKKVYYLSAEKDRYDAYNYGLKVVFRFE